MNTDEKLINTDKYEEYLKEYSSNNENLNESSVEEGNEDLKSKIPELTSKKFMRDSGALRDQIWLIPYNQKDISSLSIPTALSFPLRQLDTNCEVIMVLDNTYNLWKIADINGETEINKMMKTKVKTFKCWGSKAIIYQENNELMQIEIDSLDASPVKPGLCISVEQISCGKQHCLIATRSGYVYSYGSDEYGQLGNDNFTDQLEPGLILQLSNCRVSKVACTDYSSFAVARAKDFKLLLQNSKCDIVNLLALSEPDKDILFAWGRGNLGCLGTGDYEDRSCPTITDVTIQSNVKDLIGGSNHCLALLEDGCVYSWGSNSNGQLGRSMYVDKEASSRKVPSLEGVKEIFASGESSGCRLIDNDKLFIWGKLDEKEDISEYEPVGRVKLEEAENQKYIYTGFYNCNILTVTSKISKLLSGGNIKAKDEEKIHENTLHFINLSLNAAEQSRKISYRPDGLPKKSEEEERKHRALVYQTKKDYIESLKKEEKKKKEQEEQERKLKDQIKKDKNEKLVIWNKVMADVLPDFENIVKNMNDENKEENELRKLWMQGIPEKVRARVWARVTGNHSSLTQGLFEIMAERGKKLRTILQEK